MTETTGTTPTRGGDRRDVYRESRCYSVNTGGVASGQLTTGQSEWVDGSGRFVAVERIFNDTHITYCGPSEVLSELAACVRGFGTTCSFDEVTNLLSQVSSYHTDRDQADCLPWRPLVQGYFFGCQTGCCPSVPTSNGDASQTDGSAEGAGDAPVSDDGGMGADNEN